MSLIGLILLALAGTFYGVSHILGDRIDKWTQSAKILLENTKFRIMISCLLAFLSPLVLAIYLSVTQEDNTEWYTLIPGVIIFWGLISLTWTSFLMSLTKSKKLFDLFNNPRINQVMRNSNITSIVLGIILMIAGGILLNRQAPFVTGTEIIPIIVPIIICAIALTGIFIGFILVLMPVVFYLFILFVSCLRVLFKPGKAVWIFALTLFLSGSVLLIIDEIVQG